MNVILYGTQSCHLCDEAERILQAASASFALTWQSVDIALNTRLMERYGTRIPVLVAVAECGGQWELDWPFSLLDVLAYVRDVTD